MDAKPSPTAVDGMMDDGDRRAPVRLNVGGTVMMTSRETLMLAPAHSLLWRMFAREDDTRWRPPRLPDGSYFIDLNPVHFAVVLDVLRHGQAVVRSLDPRRRRGVACVADYLGMARLAHECSSAALLAEMADVGQTDRMDLTVATPNCLSSGSAMALCYWETKARRLVVSGQWSLRDMGTFLSGALSIEPESLVVHACAKRPPPAHLRRTRHNVLRPAARIFTTSDEIRISDIDWDRSMYSSACLFAHRVEWLCGGAAVAHRLVGIGREVLTGRHPHSATPSPLDGADATAVLVFVKRFDRAKRTLSKAKPIVVTGDRAAIVPVVRAALDIAPESIVHLFEQRSKEDVQSVDCALDGASLSYGDILWAEVVSVSDAKMPRAIEASLVGRLRSP